jgi:hypothetical protein
MKELFPAPVIPITKIMLLVDNSFRIDSSSVEPESALVVMLVNYLKSARKIYFLSHLFAGTRAVSDTWSQVELQEGSIGFQIPLFHRCSVALTHWLEMRLKSVNPS